MNIYDFLPKYPNINNTEKELLNPYKEDFYESIFKKKEFYDERYDKDSPEEILSEKGQLSKHQKFIARFLSSNTVYDSLLLVHEMGSGKTCSAIGAIEKIKNETNNFKGAYIFAKGVGLLDNFIRELRDKCTSGQYVPEGFDEGVLTENTYKEVLSDKKVTIRTRKLYEDYYHFTIGVNKPTTFQMFAKHLLKNTDSYIINKYSNHIIVLDEVHNLREKNDEDEKMYAQFHRFLHLVKNCKIILMSGTPMKDTPDEIASVMNLILPLHEQLPTGSDFLEEFLEQRGENMYKVKKKKVRKLKEIFKGRVSFVKAIQSGVKKEFIGSRLKPLNNLIVKPVKMSKFQTEIYAKAIDLDSIGNTGVYYNSRQAALFVFPDGSYGQKGFEKYVSKQEVKQTSIIKKLKKKQLSLADKESPKEKVIYEYKLISDLTKNLKGKNNEETLVNIEKCSSKYAYVIRSILESKNQCCFVYSELVTGSGSILFAKLLELFTLDGMPFSEANGNESKPGLRYGLLTFDTAGTKKINNIITRFNKADNMHGNIIKVLIGSKVVSEGYSFFNIQQEYIMTPWYNYSETDQILSRGSRLGSHKALLDAGEKPILYLTQLVSIPMSNVLSIDLYMYNIAEDKDVTIQGILRLLMESSVDCAFNYYRNRSILPLDGQRQCEYQECEYKCDGVSMDEIKDGLELNEIDDSTFKLYYSDPKSNSIYKKLDILFKKYKTLNFKTIVNLLQDEYTEKEIKNSLSLLLKKSKSNLILKDYNKLYSISNVKDIMNRVEKIFQTSFKLSLDNIIENVNTEHNFNTFEIVSALKNIIDENIIIINKYGFPSFLRESKNYYFLVNSLSSKYDYFSDYYSRVPNIINDKTFEDIFYSTQIELMPRFIGKLCNITKDTAFFKLIKTVPEDIQELFIEAAVLSQEKNIDVNTDIRKFILDYFVDYIHKIDKVWVSDRLRDGENLKCLQEDEDEWQDCDESYDEKLKENKSKRKNILFKNPWGYYGKYNPEKNTFNIVNVKEQIKKQEEKLNERIAELNSMVEDGDITEEEKEKYIELFTQDARNIYSGKNCDSWTKFILQKIAIKVLKIEQPKEFKKNISYEKLKNDVLQLNNKKHLYTTEELKDLNLNDFKRIIYWMSKDARKKELCESIKTWFASHKYKGVDMLISDRQSGNHGYLKKDTKDTKDTKDFIIKTIIPEDSPEEFKLYYNQIEKLMKQCFNIKNYKATIDDKKWIFIFKKKKIIGVLTIDTENVIWNLCVGQTYRKQGVAKKALDTAVNQICPLKNPRLFVDNKGSSYNKLIKMYTDYGFTIVSNDEDTHVTTMEFKCNKE